MTVTDVIPTAIHRSEDELPFVDVGDGTHLQVLQVDVEKGLWVVRTRYQPGVTIPRHKHTGEVFAFTIAGSWKYLEYPEINRAGSYLYEPAGSVHTLHVPEDNEEVTDVWFAIYGANLNLDAAGNVETVIDAAFIRDIYVALCEAQGHGAPNVIAPSGFGSVDRVWHGAMTQKRGVSRIPPLDGVYAVPAERREEFTRSGHTMLRGLATGDEVAAFRPALEAAAASQNREQRPITERDTYGAAFLQCVNLWRVDELARRFVLSTRFARAAAELLGVDGVRLYHDQALFKEPGGGHTPWHQDQFYWPLSTEKTITMWMPLADLAPEVGSMTFASGSHQRGNLRGHAISDESEVEFERLVRADDLAEHTYGAISAGDATFHAGWTLHRAGPNPTNSMRPVMTVIYFADGAHVTDPESAYQRFDLAVWLPGLQPGDPAASEINPVVWSRAG